MSLAVVIVPPITCSGLAYSGVSTSSLVRVKVAGARASSSRSAANQFRDAEIAELGHAFGRDQDVARLQIVADNGVLVREVNCFTDLDKQLEAGEHIEPPLVAIFVDPLTIGCD